MTPRDRHRAIPMPAPAHHPQQHASTLTVSLPMLGLVAALIAPLVTMIAFYINLAEKSESQGDRIGALETRVTQQEERVSNRLEQLNRDVTALCQARARDDTESGKGGSAPVCSR